MTTEWNYSRLPQGRTIWCATLKIFTGPHPYENVPGAPLLRDDLHVGILEKHKNVVRHGEP